MRRLKRRSNLIITLCLVFALILTSGINMSVLAANGDETASETTQDKYDTIISTMSAREKIGQMVMADFRNWNADPENEESKAVPVTELNEEIREAISRDRFGGIILFAENCAENEQTLRLVCEMQAANLDTDSNQAIPLLIAADQEGGGVARLGQGTRWTGNMALAATGDPENAEPSLQISDTAIFPGTERCLIPVSGNGRMT